jgi:hypothetical protein
MTSQELIDLLSQAKRRVHIIGNRDNGIIAALDLEGRLFAILNGRVLNKVVPSSIINRSNKKLFLNFGGDALWPAPEGTCLGYEYGTGTWRVPPAITGAVWEVISFKDDEAVIRAEIDLVNNLQIGIPCEFERHILIERRSNVLIQNVTEVIRYIGKKKLIKGEFLLAPWSLCQFDSGQGGKVILPQPSNDDIWDMYGSSLSQRGMSEGKYIVNTKTDKRFQVALGENGSWIEYKFGNDFRVRRSAGPLAPGQKYIDISDTSPDQFPSDKGVKLSVYCDPSGFMEIEACGGCPEVLIEGTEMSVKITTQYMAN